jgi:hypothetical protein
LDDRLFVEVLSASPGKLMLELDFFDECTAVRDVEGMEPNGG